MSGRGRPKGTAGYGGTLYPEAEWFQRNLERVLEIEDDAYRAAYFEGVETARGAKAAAELRKAYDEAVEEMAT